MTPRQGELWWAETEHKRRPVLVVTRSEAIPVLRRVLVAPVTSTIRGIPTEIELGSDQGLNDLCAASFDNLQVLDKAHLVKRIGKLDDFQYQICRTLAAVADC